MAAKLNFDRLKTQIDRLRKDSLEVVTSANRIVYGGVQKLADKELKALNDYYKSALASIKTVKRADDIKGVAQKQIDLLQETVNQVIGHARESIGIVAETRAELAKLIQKSAEGATIAESAIEKAVKPARKALEKVKKSAETAAAKAKKDVTKMAKTASKTASKKATKVEAIVKKDVTKFDKSAGKTAKSVEKKVDALTKSVIVESKAGLEAAKKMIARVAPSPGSRASRATSKAKHAVESVVESVTEAIDAAKAKI